MGKKLDNKGLSLIELIVAISMATIVIGAATMFLYSAEKSYRVAEYTIDLQMEAQLLMEQMSNWVMESNYIIVGGAAGSNYLVLYSMPRPNVSDSSLDYVEQNGTRRVIYLDGAKLYMKVDTETTPGEYRTEIQNKSYALAAGHNDEDCIGEYTQTFTVTIPSSVDPDNINSIIVELGMHEGISSQSQSYMVTNRFSLRNGMYDIED